MNSENIKQGIFDYIYSQEFDYDLYLKEILKRADNGNKEAIKLLIYYYSNESFENYLNLKYIENNGGYTLDFISNYYLLEGDINLAKKYAKLLLDKNCHLSYHRLGEIYFKLEKYEKMYKYLNIGINKFNCKLCKNGLAIKYYYYYKQNYNDSIKILESMIKIYPNNLHFISNLQILYQFVINNNEKAEYYKNLLLKYIYYNCKHKEVLYFDYLKQELYYLFYKFCLDGLQKNNTNSICHLGLLYHNGYYVNKDLKLAKKYYKKSIIINSKDAMWNISLIYRSERKYEKEIYYLEMASKLNCKIAIERLIDIYNNGLSEQKIDHKKVEYYQNLLEKK